MSRYTRKKTTPHFEEGKFIDKTTVTSGGKTQIPSAIRKYWQLKDGHKILWFEKNGDIIIKPSTSWGEDKTPRARGD